MQHRDRRSEIWDLLIVSKSSAEHFVMKLWHISLQTNMGNLADKTQTYIVECQQEK